MSNYIYTKNGSFYVGKFYFQPHTLYMWTGTQTMEKGTEYLMIDGLRDALLVIGIMLFIIGLYYRMNQKT
jgi:hypothetical protein